MINTLTKILFKEIYFEVLLFTLNDNIFIKKAVVMFIKLKEKKGSSSANVGRGLGNKTNPSEGIALFLIINTKISNL